MGISVGVWRGALFAGCAGALVVLAVRGVAGGPQTRPAPEPPARPAGRGREAG